MASKGDKNDKQGIIAVPGRDKWQFRFTHRGVFVHRSTGVAIEYTKAGEPSEASWAKALLLKPAAIAAVDADLDKAAREKATGRIEGKTLWDALEHYKVKKATKAGVVSPVFKAISARIEEGLKGATLLVDLTEDMIEAWRDELLESGKKVQAKYVEGVESGTKVVSAEGLAASTVNVYLQKLRAVLNRAHKKGWMPAVPDFDEVDEGDEKNVEWITREQFADLLKVADLRDGDARLSHFLRALVGTGGRWQSEVIALNWKDLDLVSNHGGVVSFNCEILPDGTVKRTKSGKGRAVPISDELRDMFVAMKLEQQKLGFGRPEDKVFMFRDPRDGVYKAWKNPTGAFKRARRDAGIPASITLHKLRHTYASWMVHKHGLKVIGEVSELLGHSSIAITKKIYTHVSVEHLRHALV